MTPYIVFCILQLLDLATTLTWLGLGGQEGNPAALWLLGFFPNQILGMLTVKATTFPVGYYIYKHFPKWVFRYINGFFALVVSWNIYWMLRAIMKAMLS